MCDVTRYRRVGKKEEHLKCWGAFKSQEREMERGSWMSLFRFDTAAQQ